MIAKKALRGKFFYEHREFSCLSVERRFERDLEALKRVLNVETVLETDFGGLKLILAARMKNSHICES